MDTNKNEPKTITYIARLIYVGGVHQELEFEAEDDAKAWVIAHDHPVVDSLRGVWVEVRRKPKPQLALDL